MHARPPTGPKEKTTRTPELSPAPARLHPHRSNVMADGTQHLADILREALEADGTAIVVTDNPGPGFIKEAEHKRVRIIEIPA